MKIKRLLAITLVFILIMGIIPVSAKTKTTKTKDVGFSLDDFIFYGNPKNKAENYLSFGKKEDIEIIHALFDMEGIILAASNNNDGVDCKIYLRLKNETNTYKYGLYDIYLVRDNKVYLYIKNTEIQFTKKNYKKQIVGLINEALYHSDNTVIEQNDNFIWYKLYNSQNNAVVLLEYEWAITELYDTFDKLLEDVCFKYVLIADLDADKKKDQIETVIYQSGKLELSINDKIKTYYDIYDKDMFDKQPMASYGDMITLEALKYYDGQKDNTLFISYSNPKTDTITLLMFSYKNNKIKFIGKLENIIPPYEIGTSNKKSQLKLHYTTLDIVDMEMPLEFDVVYKIKDKKIIPYYLSSTDENLKSTSNDNYTLYETKELKDNVDFTIKYNDKIQILRIVKDKKNSLLLYVKVDGKGKGWFKLKNKEDYQMFDKYL